MTVNETELRQRIAEQVRYELMPSCVCEECGTLRDGRIVEQAIEIILCPESGKPSLPPADSQL